MGLEMVELAMDCEDEFGITITDEHWASLMALGKTSERVGIFGARQVADFQVRDFQELIERLIGEVPTASSNVRERGRQLISESLGIPLEQVEPESWFFRDLRID